MNSLKYSTAGIEMIIDLLTGNYKLNSYFWQRMPLTDSAKMKRKHQ